MSLSEPMLVEQILLAVLTPSSGTMLGLLARALITLLWEIGLGLVPTAWGLIPSLGQLLGVLPVPEKIIPFSASPLGRIIRPDHIIPCWGPTLVTPLRGHIALTPSSDGRLVMALLRANKIL